MTTELVDVRSTGALFLGVKNGYNELHTVYFIHTCISTNVQTVQWIESHCQRPLFFLYKLETKQTAGDSVLLPALTPM